MTDDQPEPSEATGWTAWPCSKCGHVLWYKGSGAFTVACPQCGGPVTGKTLDYDPSIVKDAVAKARGKQAT